MFFKNKVTDFTFYIGEWTRSVRESVQARLENQLNNKEIKIENGKIREHYFEHTFFYISLKNCGHEGHAGPQKYT